VKQYCRNCFYPLPNKAKFCPSCGQKDSDGKVRMRTMLRKLWDNTFHLEGKFLRTCWQLFVPGKVTVEFFKGKQDRYPHPLRMFGIVMFFFLYMVNVTINDAESKRGPILKISTTSKVENGGTTEHKSPLSPYERMRYEVMLHDMRLDYAELPEVWKNVGTRKAVDSLLRKMNVRHGIDDPGLLDSLDNASDTTTINLWGDQEIKLSTRDIVRYTPDEIIARYDIKDWLIQVFLRQSIKSFKSPEAFVHAYLGSLTWAILALVGIMSAVLSLLYWRQKRFYVEHFIFLLHFHTGMMLASLLAMIGAQLGIWNEKIVIWVFIGISFFAYGAMRRFYRQGIGKTFVKWLLFGILYYVIFIVLFILGLLLVFAMY